MNNIGIIDYGMGNLHSVENALRYIGCDTFISNDFRELNYSDGLILPGVGAFPDAIESIKGIELDKFMIDYSQRKPLLGICLGMQLLFDVGKEFRICEGLGLIHGEVVKINHAGVKVPHMGWNGLTLPRRTELTEGINNGDQVYFVHSYKAVVKNRQELAATSDYNGEITAIVNKGNVYGCQFHPEKSGDVGLKILDNFRRIVNDNITGN